MDRARQWPTYALPAAIATASRAYSIAVITAVATVSGMHRSVLSIWDAAWYLRIAATGYHGRAVFGLHDFAFFPAWPALVKLASLGVLPPDVTGAVLANMLFIVAVVLIWIVLAARLGDGAATGGVLLLAFAPPAYVFSLPYSETLFLAAAALFFCAGPDSRWRLPLAALAMLTRIAGAALVASSLLVAARTTGRHRYAALAAAAGGILAFAIWWAFIALLTRQFAGFLLGSPSWDHGGSGLTRLIAALHRPTVERVAWLAFFVLVTLGAVGLARVDLELAAFSLAALSFALLPGGTVNSMPRYALSAFPAFGGLALWAQRPGWKLLAVVAVAFAVGQIAFASWVLAAPPHAVAP